MPGARLYLIDAFNLIFRAYHARQRTGAAPMRTSRGTSTEAVYIFYSMLRRIRRAFAPDHWAVAMESPGPTFRDERFPAYKANRTETPAELLEQLPLIDQMLAALRIPVLREPGFEADDLMGAAAAKFTEAEVVIVTSDKDMLQLVDDRVRVLDPMKNDTLYDPEKVREYKGVAPERIADLLALTGDSVDNIPGAPGIGDKGAVQLIEQFGSVESILDHAAEVPRKAYRESLLNHRDQILLSKELATIARHAPVPQELSELAVADPDLEQLGPLFREWEFLSFLKELGGASSETPPASRRHEELVDAAAVSAFLESVNRAGFELQPGDAAGLTKEDSTATASLSAVLDEWRKPGRTWVLHDYKAALSAGLPACGGAVEDTLLLGFLVLADPSAADLSSLAIRYLGRKSDAGAAFDLAPALRAAVEEQQLGRIYDEIDLPLAPILARMERTGIRVDKAALAALAASMDADINSLTARIYELAKHPFNINSPPQLGKVLFEELGLPSGGKTGKTKNYSTAADVLESLAPQYEIARQVLDYRQLTKLKGTYVDALPALLDEQDRVHTTFNPAGAATGRLSSSNPNLQNIPVRTELGRAIRAAFVPEPGWDLLVADYSQIELRLLAHFSQDAVLLDAFRKGEDIHTRTAAEVFGVPPLMITPDQRRAAKTVNFGIVYGQTAFGLAAQLGIPKSEAEDYIRAYFDRYAGVKKWIDRQIAGVRKTGYTQTLHGRRRTIPDMDAKNPNVRGFAERTAVNTPLQGTAADLIKVAMIELDRKLAGRRARLLLQVHDELVLECPPEETAATAALVKSVMESVAKLEVPLLAETGAGPNWRDAKH